MSKKRLHTNNRITSFLLAVLMVLQTMVGVPLVASAASSATSQGLITFPEGLASVQHTQTLRDNQDGTFTLDLTFLSKYSEQEQSIHSRMTKSGGFVAPRTGDYLVELWGGAGGSVSGGGTGGQGGYVYATVHLEIGDTLYYQIGGNGQSTTGANAGGGANGGGPSGAQVRNTVAGGGGYSAVYLFDSSDPYDGTFEETDRTTKYILIAGGGGGGGSAAGANGGRAGYIFEADAAQIAENPYKSGSVYFGYDGGRGEGWSNDYIGRKGSLQAGIPPITNGLTGGNVSGSQPNDWHMTEATSPYPGGYGGSGNLGGGGGGAGFAGGSGGVEAGGWWLLAGNVGGGGGGSSYVASAANITVPAITSDEYVSYALNSSDPLAGNPSGTGGAISITCLTDGETDYLENISLHGKTSKYYTVSSANANVSIDSEGNFTISDIDLPIVSDATVSVPVTVSLTFTPNTFDGVPFMGGYDVPLFDGDITATFVSATPSCNKTVVFELGDHCSYVNAPLKFEIIAHSKQSFEPLYNYDLSQLYEDNYAEVRGQIAQGTASPAYDFIGAVSEPYVKTDRTQPAITATDIEDNALFYVGLDITPKTVTPQHATVGYIGATTIYATVGVYIVSVGQIALNSSTLDLEKSLAYGEVNGLTGSYYTYTLDVTSSLKIVGAESTTVLENTTVDGSDIASGSEGAVTIPEGGEGEYYIEITGGSGGDGSTRNSTLGTQAGGTGGTGGHLTGYVYLRPGDKIEYFIGVDGTNAPNQVNTTKSTGGQYSYIRMIPYDDKDSPVFLLIAGGGGGGGNAVLSATGFYGNKGQNGNNGASNSIPSSQSIPINVYAGNLELYNGSQGELAKDPSTWLQSVTGGGGGNAGYNYKNDRVYDVSIDNDFSPSTSISGSVHIECSSLTYSTQNVASVLEAQFQAGYNFTADVLQYFEVVRVSCEDQISADTANVQIGEGISLNFGQLQTVSGGVGYTPISSIPTDSNGNPLLDSDGSHPLNGIKPNAVVKHTYKDADGNVLPDKNGAATLTAEADLHFIIEIVFKPRDGFLGGNDVPIFKDDSIVMSQTISGAFAEEIIEKSTQTEHVNVAINYQPTASDMVVNDAYYVLGDTPGVAASSMVSVGGASPIPSYGDWRDEFVKPITPDLSQFYTPSYTTQYTFEYGLAPTTAAEDSEAMVIEAVGPKTISKTATIYVQAPVEYTLFNIVVASPDMNSDGRYLTDYLRSDNSGATIYADNDYVTTLQPLSAGYTLPDEVTVEIGGATPAFTYDKVSGQITIPAEHITGPITITALTQLTLTVNYQTYTDGTIGSETAISHPTAGAEIDQSFLNQFSPASSPVGYSFTWDYSNVEIKNGKYVMPERDAVINGYFAPNLYSVKANFIGATPTGSPDAGTDIPYGGTVDYTVPTLDGYVADKTSISGEIRYEDGQWYVGIHEATLSGSTLTVDVTYTATSGKAVLTIYYLNKLTGDPMAPTYQQTYTINGNKDQSYDQDSPDILGYTCDRPVVSGTLKKNDVVTITVYYTPVTYQITLDYQDAGATPNGTRYVQYDNIYGYKADVGDYESLPFPSKPGGFKFVGWYYSVTDANGVTSKVYVTDTTTVTLTTAHTLYAEWDPPIIYVVVDWGNLDFNYESGVWNPLTHQYEYSVNTNGQSFQPKGTNTITVTNGYIDAENDANSIRSDIPVYTTISYTKENPINTNPYFTGNIGVQFTNTANGSAFEGGYVSHVDNNSLTVTVDPYLIDNDPLDVIQSGDSIVIGNCKVSISKEKPTS